MLARYIEVGQKFAKLRGAPFPLFVLSVYFLRPFDRPAGRPRSKTVLTVN